MKPKREPENVDPGNDEIPLTEDDREKQEDRDLLWEDGDPADRRRDPLRKPV